MKMLFVMSERGERRWKSRKKERAWAWGDLLQAEASLGDWLAGQVRGSWLLFGINQGFLKHQLRYFKLAVSWAPRHRRAKMKNPWLHQASLRQFLHQWKWIPSFTFYPANCLSHVKVKMFSFYVVHVANWRVTTSPYLSRNTMQKVWSGAEENPPIYRSYLHLSFSRRGSWL